MTKATPIVPQAIPFKWVPKTPPNSEALRRLKQAFPRPREPMGEAWFMSVERKFFTDLVDKDLQDVDWLVLSDVFFNLTSGPICFGERLEWRIWYHYILANLVERASEQCVGDKWSESLVSGFMVLYPEDVSSPPYPSFLRDVFDTLVISPMSPDLWDGDEIVPEKSLLYYACGLQRWQWSDKVSGEFSALLFFCLKYLPASDIGSWVESIIALPSHFYRAQFLLWLLASKDVLSGKVESPAAFRRRHPLIETDWQNSHSINSTFLAEDFPKKKAVFLPPDNVAAFKYALEQHLTQPLVLDWLLRFESIPLLKSELLDFGRDKDFLDMFDLEGRFNLNSLS